MNRTAVVTGLGFITSIGNDRASVTASLCALRGGIERVEFVGNPALSVKVAGTVKDFTVDSPSWRDWRTPTRYEIPRETLRGLAPHGVYAMCAAEQAIADAGLTREALTDEATGLYCASAGSAFLLHHHLAQMHAARFERGNPLGVVMSIAGTLNFNLAAHYGIRGAVGGFAAACASSSHALGCALDEATPDLADADEIFHTLRAWQFELDYGQLLDRQRDQLKDTVIWNIEAGRKLSGQSIGAAELKRTALFNRMHGFMQRYEFLILPVNQVPPFDVNQPYVTEINGVHMDTYIDWMKSCYFITVTGHPAISVPCGFTAEGLPVGVQIVGRHQDDFGVLQLAFAFEQATQLWKRRPAIAI